MDMIALGRRDLHSDYLVYVSYIYIFAIQTTMLTGCGTQGGVTMIRPTSRRHYFDICQSESDLSKASASVTCLIPSLKWMSMLSLVRRASI